MRDDRYEREIPPNAPHIGIGVSQPVFTDRQPRKALMRIRSRLTTQLVQPGLIRTLVHGTLLSLDEILDHLSLSLPHLLLRNLLIASFHLHIRSGSRNIPLCTLCGLCVDARGSNSRLDGTYTSTRRKTPADIVLALLALLGTVDPGLVNVLQREIDGSDLFAEFVRELCGCGETGKNESVREKPRVSFLLVDPR
jgi:hypothetical protein